MGGNSEGLQPLMLPKMELSENGKTLNRFINQLIPMKLDDDDLEKDINTDSTKLITPTQQDIDEQRYNLCSRKKICYDEDQSNKDSSRNNKNFSIILNLVNPTFFMLLCLTAFLIGTSADTFSVKCNGQGIQSRGPFKSLSRCGNCSVYLNMF
ncbi:hypothetical protein GCK72_022059 [Caenorhabditis remanei]|uniref:Uncharacterized protein n=1 Tax=Caenorhabditis remanei TaxID=31234 RepID=A0A6A5FST0_CAERE|nr:hypothetical protein GCK72_022059 [Caenorhabditis remanei]KAF1745612.1 hypothetical protein GCK72_022059 [Caenorhabditis remanei]